MSMRGLIIFDFDGTLYRTVEPFKFYADRLADAMPIAMRDRYRAEVSAYLHGTKVVLSDDHWEALKYLAIPFVGDKAPWDQAFADTRLFMKQHVEMLEIPSGLLLFLERVHHQDIVLTCVSNSPSDAVDPLLNDLGLREYFHHVATGAQKPDGLLHMASRLWGGRPVPDRMLSIGDHYHNDIAPAVRAGWATAHVHPFGYFPGPASIQAVTLEGVLSFAEDWANQKIREVP